MKANTWIALLAYEGCIRHAADCRRNQETATRLAAVHSRVVAELRYAIALEIESFLGAHGDRSGLTFTCHDDGSAQGFVVSRMDDGIRTRHVAVDLKAGALSCRYDRCGGSANAASGQRELTMHIENDGSALSLWEGGLHRTFATIDALTVFLLAPILDEVSVVPETCVN
jgi:hypothetical protein